VTRAGTIEELTPERLWPSFFDSSCIFWVYHNKL
jgi:hypothetical protein